MIDNCIRAGCQNATEVGSRFCVTCNSREPINTEVTINATQASRREDDISMSQRYPKYYKPIPEGVKELDVYGVCAMFPVQDDTGCINHARKKLLVPGTRTGGKNMYNDIKEARDTLNRWLELNKVPLGSPESFKK